MVDCRRLFRAQYQDIQIIEQIDTRSYRVSGSQNKVYKVNLNTHSCTCPDWTDQAPRGGCKHILKIKLEHGEMDKLSYHQTTVGTSKSNSYADNWRSLRKRVLELDRWECQKCNTKGKPVGTTELHVHHIIPKSRGGKDKISNLITLCHPCHEDVHGHKIPSGRYGSNSQGRSDGVDQTQERTNSSDSQPVNSEEPDGTVETSGENLFSQRFVENAPPPWSHSHPEYWESSSPITSSTSRSSSKKSQSDTSPNPESNEEIISSQNGLESSESQPTPRPGNKNSPSQRDSKSDETPKHSETDDIAHSPQISTKENNGNKNNQRQTYRKKQASNQSATDPDFILGLAVVIGILSYAATQNLSLSIGSSMLVLIGYLITKSMY